MVLTEKTFDPVWESLYASGKHLNKYPFNNMPNYFFRYRPSSSETPKVLEVGFGAANNLWMCAREGALVYGVEASKSAVAFAVNRFAEEELSGDLQLGDFCNLPYKEDTFDMAINRQSLTQVSHTRAKIAVSEISRCLKIGGTFWSNMFSDQTFHNGKFVGDGLWNDITEGRLQGVGQTAFHSEADIRNMYGPEWEILELSKIDQTDCNSESGNSIYSEWICVTQKIC